jgi:hypothetical protein
VTLAGSINIKAKQNVGRKTVTRRQLIGQKKEDQMSTENKVSGAQEDNFTGMIESQAAQIPSSAFLGAALGSMAISSIGKASGKVHAALFVGQWAAPFLLLGIYNKLVKQLGSDAETRESKRPRAQAATA